MEKPNFRLKATLRCNKLGFAIFPCKPKGKIPIVKGGCKSASKDVVKIEKYWIANPDANIGIATGKKSGFFAVDIDGEDGRTSLASLESKHGKLPITVTVLSPNNGCHLYFLTHGKKIKTNASVVGKGIDLRGDGGYVLGAGSKLKTGKYRYASGCSPKDIEIASPPQWLLDMVVASEKPTTAVCTTTDLATEDDPDSRALKYGAAALESEISTLLAATKGKRNDTLNNAALVLGQLVASGMLDETQVRTKLAEAAHKIGLEDAEISNTIESGITAGKKEPRALPPQLKTDDAPPTILGTQYEAVAKCTVNYEKTDIGNAERLLALYPEEMIYCDQFGWLIYDGKYFQKDTGKRSMLRAQAVPALIRAEAALLSDSADKKQYLDWAKRSANATSIERMLKMAAPKAPVTFTALDADPMLLNVSNGTLDLRTGTLRPHSPKDLLTAALDTPFDPDAECPIFKRFLREIFKGDKEMIRFIQRAVGYSLTGDAKEQVMFYCYGVGRNGKSTLINTLRDMLTSYGINVATETLMEKKHGNEIRNDLARLYGTRMVTALETNHGKRLDESLIKRMTGGDKVVARFLFKEHFEFQPQFKLWFSANYYLHLTSSDDSIWRRILLLPFDVVIAPENVDADLPKKLKAEFPGILAWAVRGCLKWQKYGLNPPQSVIYAGSQYRSNTDHVKKFTSEACVLEKSALVPKADLYGWYEKWCEKNDTPPHSKMAFGKVIKALKYEEHRKGTKRYWKGLRIKY